MNRKLFLPILLILQIIGLQCLSFFSEFIEKCYSNGLYPIIAAFSRTIFGWIPFSFGDIIYGIVIVWSLRWLYKNRKATWKTKTLSILSFVSIAYFAFHFLWAFNYYRLPLSQKMNLKTDYTQEQLVVFTKKLIAKTNEVHLQITKDTALKITVPYEQQEIFKKALNGYNELATIHPEFKYENPSQKTSLMSTALTYMGFGGYLNPFTNEAQVNSLIPLYNFPTTSCHEMAHQIGYGSESECNFIGFLASHHNPDSYFQYSGYTYALRYCLSNIGVKDEKQLNSLLKTINPGVLKNFQESEIFWDSHQSFIDQGFEIFYDNFLKINQQKDGMESYSKFVNLLVNYYEDKEL